MNYDDIYNNNNHIQNIASENYDLSHFMAMCMSKGIEFNPAYKDSTNKNGFSYISFMFNEKNLELIYAIVALLRTEGYEFTFEKLNEKESAFNITDVINSKENTKLFEKLNDLIVNYDSSKNYYYDLPEDLQKYFDICSFAHSDKKAATSNSEDNLKLKYIKQEDGHKYTIETNDERYIQAADISDFKLSSDDATSYEIISDNNNELSNNLDSFNNSLGEIEKTDSIDKNSQDEESLDFEEEKEEKQVKEDETTEEEVVELDREKEDVDEKEKEEEQEEHHEDEIPLTNPLVDEEEPTLDEDTLMQKNDKFIDTLNVPPIVDIKEEEVLPQIDLNEINNMIYEGQEPEIEEQDVMVR